MSLRSRPSVQQNVTTSCAEIRLQAAIAAIISPWVDASRRRFVRGFLTTLSALSLTAYQPALSQDVVPEDGNKIPREPHNGETTQRGFAAPRGSMDSADRHASSPQSIPVLNDQPVSGPKQPFDIPAGKLSTALIEFSRQSGVQIVSTSEVVGGLQSPGLQGEFTVEDAMHRLLEGTGLQYRFTNPTSITVHRAMSMDHEERQDSPSKLIKVPEVVVKDVRERPTWTTPVDGYKADHASTVTRSTMSIAETPTSIGVVTRDIIKDTFSRTQADALEAVSGVTRSQSLGRSEGINVRGFAVCNFNGSFNGMKVNGLPTDCLFAPDWGIVERYEVVKGPASIVGGAATPGGVINRITKTPQRSNFANVEANFGSYDFYRGLLDVNGVMPNREYIRGRLVFAVEEGGNFVNFTPARQYTVAPSVEFDLFKGAGKLLVVGTYQKFDGASYPGWPLTRDGKMLNVPRTSNFGGGANAGAHANFTGYNGELHYDHKFIHDIKLTARGKVSRSHVTDNSVYAYNSTGIPPSGDSYIPSSLHETRFDTYAGELFLSKEFALFGQKHEILAGADHRNMKQDYTLGYTYLPVGGSPAIDNVFNPRNAFPVAPADFLRSIANTKRHSTLKQTGVFAQTVIRPFERLTLVFAGRYDEAQSTNQDKLLGVQRDQTSSQFTGRAGATVKVTDWMNLYGGVQQSFAPQPFNITRNNELLEPETGINYEVGAKLHLLDERLRITTALFRTYRRNVATLDPEDLRFSIAVGEQRNQGAELDVNGQPIPGLNLNANFTYLDAVITEDNDPALVGMYPIRVPRAYTGRVFTTYELQSGPLQGFGFGGGVYFQGAYELSFPNMIKTDPYQRVDALLFYRGNREPRHYKSL